MILTLYNEFHCIKKEINLARLYTKYHFMTNI